MGNTIGISVCLVLMQVVNYLCWRSMARAHPGRRPWHWTVLLGPFGYYPWLSRWERSNPE